MELVYLWVEDYKNIHRQGFNFSPRFNCEYDEEKNELTIDENNKHIENFFGDNINVTAIVGKNGSGKSSLLNYLESGKEEKTANSFLIYTKNEKYYCEFNNSQPEIIFNKVVKYIAKNDFSNDEFYYPKIIRIAHSKKIGEGRLSHFYFDEYSGIYGGMNIHRFNFYNMLEARFFVPRYIDIAIKHFKLFDRLKQMYKFDTLRLLLKNNSTFHIRKYIDEEVISFRDHNRVEHGLPLINICTYEDNDNVDSILRRHSVNRDNITINLYDKKRVDVVSVLEDIERIHRAQTYQNEIQKYNRYQEFDLAVLIAFIEYYLKNTAPCESSTLIYQELVILKDEIENNLMIHDRFIRIRENYILGFLEKLINENFRFEKDDSLTIEEIIEAIKYLQKFEVHHFDTEGNPYMDISIDEKLKENIKHIKIMQKIFFDSDFDCGNEKFLRVFEYDLVNNRIGSSYETISDGEKHFVRFSIDIIYYLQTLKNYNLTPNKEDLAIFLVDEPDNAMHPIWKKKLISSALEIYNNYSDIPNIKIHFIFTTHSPFLLSDIPKQNIIFLDRYPDGKCKVLRDNEVMTKEQTFGQNIHTLLSDSFFMGDGLMGQFAKGKIEEVIKLLNQSRKLSKKKKEYCQDR